MSVWLDVARVAIADLICSDHARRASVYKDLKPTLNLVSDDIFRLLQRIATRAPPVDLTSNTLFALHNPESLTPRSQRTSVHERACVQLKFTVLSRFSTTKLRTLQDLCTVTNVYMTKSKPFGAAEHHQHFIEVPQILSDQQLTSHQSRTSDYKRRPASCLHLTHCSQPDRIRQRL